MSETIKRLERTTRQHPELGYVIEQWEFVPVGKSRSVGAPMGRYFAPASGTGGGRRRAPIGYARHYTPRAGR